MRLIYINICVAIGLSLILTSCEKVIEFDIPESDPKIVLNGYLSLGEVLKVNASSSLSYLDNGEPEFITLNSIALYKDGVFIEDLQLENEDFSEYVSSSPLASAGTYEIRASKIGYESVIAASYIPEQLTDVQVAFLGTDANNELEYEISFTDPASDDDYYHLISVVESGEDNFIIGFSSNSEVFFSDGLEFNLEGENQIYEGGIFPDDLINNSNVKIKFKIIGENFEDQPKKIQLIKCSEDYYQYHKSYRAFQIGGGPFSVPVQVYTNVENGLGVIAGYTLQEFDLIDLSLIHISEPTRPY